jgi:hypothetical protein
MEIIRPFLAGSRAAEADGAAATGDARARELAETELRAAIAVVARNPAYRVLVCGMATDAQLIARLDGLAAGGGVVLERRIRRGGGVDVVVRAE